MDKKLVGGGFALGLITGIIIDNLALGIMVGLMLGAGASAAKGRQGKL